jgi:hypothetical protein
MNLEIEQCDADDILNATNLPCFGGSATVPDANYFKSDVEALSFEVNLGSQLTTPFPAGDTVPAKVANITPDFGGVVSSTVIDNISCEGGTSPCDMLYDGQSGKSNWFGTFVPEPGSVALLGLGLGVMGGFARRMRRRDEVISA